MPESTRAGAEIAAALAPLTDDPGNAAILLDLDGTLAPIVGRPEDATVPSASRELLERAVGTYGLVAVVTGRRAEDARRIVAVPALTYAGIHGFELLRPGAGEAELAPLVAEVAGDAPGFADRADGEALSRAGLRREDKGPIVALHWRAAPDEAAAERIASSLAAEAEAEGLVTHRGRMVLELRPPVAIDKGRVVGELLDEAGSRAALYAGDDRTDLDAFVELARRRDSGGLDAIVRVGVRSEEGPAEIAERADLTLEGQGDVVELLQALSR